MRMVASTATILLLAACGTTGTERSDPPPGAGKTISIELAHLPTGASPTIPWRHGRELHDGKRRVTFDGDVNTVVLTRQRVITTTIGDAGTSLDVRDTSGHSQMSFPVGYTDPVLNRERNIVAWVDADLTPLVLQDDQAKPLSLAKPRGADGGLESIGQAVAVLGRDCAHDAETVEGAGCSVYFNWDHDPNGDAYVSSSHGFADRVGGGSIHRLFDVSPQRALIGDGGAGIEHPISRYVGPNGRGYVAKGYVPRAFSPDGRRIVSAPPTTAEGSATDELSIRDATTGQRLLTVKCPKTYYPFQQTAWEDDSHLLSVVALTEDEWGIVRLGLNGTADYAVAPVKGISGNPALDLAIQP